MLKARSSSSLRADRSPAFAAGSRPKSPVGKFVEQWSVLQHLAASVTDPHQFRSGRQFAAWLGLTLLQHSSGGKERLGRISKMGDKYLRRLLVVGMTSLIRRAKYKPDAVDPWLADLLSRKPARLVTVALANKAARGGLGNHGACGGVYRRPAGVMIPV